MSLGFLVGLAVVVMAVFVNDGSPFTRRVLLTLANQLVEHRFSLCTCGNLARIHFRGELLHDRVVIWGHTVRGPYDVEASAIHEVILRHSLFCAFAAMYSDWLGDGVLVFVLLSNRLVRQNSQLRLLT